MQKSPDLIYIIDGTFDGILTAVFVAMSQKKYPAEVCDKVQGQLTFGTKIVHIDTDLQKSQRVQSGILKKISRLCLEEAYTAHLAGDELRHSAIFDYIVEGFCCGKDIDRHLDFDCVLKVHKLAKYVRKEAHNLTGFTRFSHAKNGVYVANISPVNDVLQLIAPHFADRMSGESWVIRDKIRNTAAIHAGGRWAITQVPHEMQFEPSEDEARFSELWKTFFNQITVEGRENSKLQRNLLPLRYRENMLEFE